MGQIKLIGVGATAEVYEYDSRVLKLFYNGYDKNYVKWEYDKTKNVYESGLPAVKVYEIIERNDRYGFIMDKVTGESLQSIMLTSLFAGEVMSEKMLNSYIHENMKIEAETICKIHKASSSVVDSLERVTISALNVIDELSGKEKAKVVEILKSLKGSRCICHGDPNPGNIILTDDGPVFIDWMNCMMAPELYDAANIYVMYKYLSLPPDIPKEASQYIMSIKDTISDIFLDEYKKIAEIDSSEFKKLMILAMVLKLQSKLDNNMKNKLVDDLKDEIDKYENR